MKFNFPRLNQKEIEITNKPIRSTEIETVIKKLPKTKAQGQIFTGEFYQSFKANPYPSKTLPKKLHRKEHFQTHSMRLPSPCCQNQTKTTQKRKLQAISTDESRFKSPHQNSC